jgi:hypothetical protein
VKIRLKEDKIPPSKGRSTAMDIENFLNVKCRYFGSRYLAIIKGSNNLDRQQQLDKI